MTNTSSSAPKDLPSGITGAGTTKYILVVADTYLPDGSLCAAYNVAQSRLKRCSWPIYATTRNRTSMAMGDEILIYIAGQKVNRQKFVAKARIANIHKPKPIRRSDDPIEVMDSDSFLMLSLDNVEFISPVDIKEIAERLDFFPKNNPKWGTILMGGSRKISERDYQEIVGR